MGSILREALTLLHPHYFVNFFLSSLFFLSKVTVPFCHVLYEDCQLELREWELLMFLGCIVVIKNRKQPSYKTYISTVCMFAKALNVILFFRHNPILGVIYILFCLLHLAFLPEPAYKGPDHVVYFRGPNLEEELKRDPRVTWIIEFYAAWSPSCVSFANTFATLSSKYHLDNLRFGKLDASRYSDIAEKYKVSISSWSKQLPTIIMFRAGKEVKRRPTIDIGGNVTKKFIFSEDNVISDFELNDIHLQCKKNPIRKRNRRDLEKRGTENGHMKSE